MVRIVLLLTVLVMFAAACKPEKDGTSPAPSAVPTHIEPENFNDAVLTGAHRSAEAGFTGTYTLRSTVDGTTLDGTVTWSRKGTKARADFDGLVDGANVQLDLITGPTYPADDLLYACKPVERTCAEVRRAAGGDYAPELLPGLVSLRVLDVTTLAEGLKFADESARPVAGQQALCFVGQSEATPQAAVDHGEVCLTDDGLPLLVTSSSPGRTVSFTTNKLPDPVDDNAFDLPFELQP